jgi:hypothetical protein
VHNDDIEDVDEALEDVPMIHSRSRTTSFERPPLQLEHAEAAPADVGAAREAVGLRWAGRSAVLWRVVQRVVDSNADDAIRCGSLLLNFCVSEKNLRGKKYFFLTIRCK